MDLIDLAGRSLESFRVAEYTEVFMTNDDGLKTQSKGYFEDENIAKSFAGIQTDANWHKTRKAFLLTDGTIGFVLNGERVEIVDDEKTALEVRKRILAKLTSEERRVLGV